VELRCIQLNAGTVFTCGSLNMHLFASLLASLFHFLPPTCSCIPDTPSRQPCPFWSQATQCGSFLQFLVLCLGSQHLKHLSFMFSSFFLAWPKYLLGAFALSTLHTFIPTYYFSAFWIFFAVSMFPSRVWRMRRACYPCSALSPSSP
jgi:hypothetical protein